MVEKLDRLDKPYNDTYLEYNYKESRYVLTTQGANESNLDMLLIFGNEDNLKQYLDLLSRTIYSVFFKNTDSKYYEKKLWLLSHSKRYRKAIFQIFMDVIWYNYRSGGFMTLYQSGINMNEMKVIELTIENAMSVIGNNMANITGLNERVLRTKIVEKHYFEDLEELKDYMFDKDLINEKEYDEIESVNDIKSSFKYLIYLDMFSDKYVLEDYTFWKRELMLRGTEW